MSEYELGYALAHGRGVAQSLFAWNARRVARPAFELATNYPGELWFRPSAHVALARCARLIEFVISFIYLLGLFRTFGSVWLFDFCR